MKTILVTVSTLLSVLFGLLALMWLGTSVAISELDDIRVIEFFGFPCVILSSGLASLIAVLGYRRIFLVPSLLNVLSAIAAFVGGLSGVTDIMKLQNKVYPGHQGNDYHSIDLFIIAIVPISSFVISWLTYCYYKKSRIPKETTHNRLQQIP